METVSEIETGNELDRILSSKTSDDVFVFHVLRFVPVWDLTRSVQLVNKATAKCVWRSLEQSNLYDWTIFLKKDYRFFPLTNFFINVNGDIDESDSIRYIDHCVLKGGKITCSLHLFHKLIKIGAINLKKCRKKLLFLFIDITASAENKFLNGFIHVIECLLSLTEEAVDYFEDNDFKKSIFHYMIFDRSRRRKREEKLISLFYRFPTKFVLPSREFIFEYFLNSQKRKRKYIPTEIEYKLIVFVLFHQNGMYPNLCQELFQYAVEDFGDQYIVFFLYNYFSASEEFRKHEKIYLTKGMIETCIHNGFLIKEDRWDAIDDMEAFINTLKYILRYFDRIGLWDEFGKTKYKPVSLNKNNEIPAIKKQLKETIKLSQDTSRIWSINKNRAFRRIRPEENAGGERSQERISRGLEEQINVHPQINEFRPNVSVWYNFEMNGDSSVKVKIKSMRRGKKK